MKNAGTTAASAGFTLLELLVVLAVLGMLSAIALPYLRLNSGTRLRSFTHALVADLRQGRADAIRNGTTTTLIIGEEKYTLQPSARSRALPAGIFLRIEAAPGRLLEPAGNLSFFSDGSSTGGVLTIKQGDAAVRIVVRGLDGKPSEYE